MTTILKDRFLRFSIAQQALFARRLALYLRAGVSLTTALGFILEDTPDRSIRKILQQIEQTVASGRSLSDSLAKFPTVFTPFTKGFVQAGEASGTLADTLERLAVHLAKQQTLRNKILSALAYPALVLVGTIGVAGFLTLFIFPKIVPVLEGFRTRLPFSTRMLIAINNVITHDGFWIVLSAAGLVAVIGAGLRYPRVQWALETVLLRTPLLATLRRSYSLATFSRSLTIQLSGGIRIIPALALTNLSLSSPLYREAIRKIEKDITEGQRFSIAVRNYPRLFPPVVCQLITVGEATGSISQNLSTIADLYEETLDELAKNLTVLVEPVLMIVMGFVVGFVALAIITPIYQVTQSLNIS